MPYVSSSPHSQQHKLDPNTSRKSITSENKHFNKNGCNKASCSKAKTNRFGNKTKLKDLTEANPISSNLVHLNNGESAGETSSSFYSFTVAKRSRRPERLQDNNNHCNRNNNDCNINDDEFKNEKKSKIHEFPTSSSSSQLMLVNTDQVFGQNQISPTQNPQQLELTPSSTLTTNCEENSKNSKEAKTGKNETAMNSNEKLKRIKNPSPRRNAKKHIRKLDFSMPMEILNTHAFLLWFSERYQEYSRQYPNESVRELQDRRRPQWDLLDYRKKAPYYQRARDASCVQYTPSSPDYVSCKVPEKSINNTSEVKVESRAASQHKIDPPLLYPLPTAASLAAAAAAHPLLTPVSTYLVPRETGPRHYHHSKYEFDLMVKDLIWGWPVHFDNTTKSEKLTQILKDLADLEASGKLTCSIK